MPRSRPPIPDAINPQLPHAHVGFADGMCHQRLQRRGQRDLRCGQPRDWIGHKCWPCDACGKKLWSVDERLRHRDGCAAAQQQ